MVSANVDPDSPMQYVIALVVFGLNLSWSVFIIDGLFKGYRIKDRVTNVYTSMVTTTLEVMRKMGGSGKGNKEEEGIKGRSPHQAGSISLQDARHVSIEAKEHVTIENPLNKVEHKS